jgi:hypothetical protein
MIAQPQSFKCTLLIEHIKADTAIPDKYQFSGKLLGAEESARENSFYANGRSINGFTFYLSPQIKEGTTVKADVSFMGDPFVQNYQLNNIEPVG